MDKIIIIDGNSLVNRAFYAIQRPMMTKDGIYTQGIYGFLSMLFKINEDYKPTHMLVAFDRKAPTFRHIEYEQYKAGRKKMPIELAMEMPILKEVLTAMGISMYEIDGFEADDIIGTVSLMAEEAGVPAYIITGDKDALQLASDKTSVIITKKGISEFVLYDDNAMMAEYGFDHIQFIDYKALRGDTSDNVPGIPGVGEKTALKLIQEYGSVEEVIKHVDELKGSLKTKVEEGAMSAMMSKRLVTIVRNVPVDFSIEDCRIKKQDTSALIELYKKLEFKNYLNKLVREGASAEVNSAVSIEVPTEFPEVKLIDSSQLETYLSGDVLIDFNTDNDHLSSAVVSSCEIFKDGQVYVCENPDLSKFNGKNIDIRGFGLGRVFYALISNGIDVSGITNKFDAATARYVLSPSTKTPNLESLILETFQINIASEDAQISLFEKQAADYTKISKKLVLLNELIKIQKAEIESEGLEKVLYEIEFPLTKVLASMESEGFKIDANELGEFGKKLKNMIVSLEYEIHDMAGEDFNINSPSQLSKVLFEKLQIPYPKKNAKSYSTNADILEKLKDDYPIVAKVLEYRTYAKLNSTYVEGLLPLIGQDGKVHAHFQQTVTATGRISCTEPNLQNIPVRSELGRQLRRVFTAQSSDYVLVGADYSQIELRVMAHMAEDPELIEAFNNGHDIHKETASKVFKVPLNRVTPQMRSNAKAVNFGVIYGMSSFGLAGELTITRAQADKYIQDYFERFKGVKAFMDKSVADCKSEGSVRTLYGRKRTIPEINASNYMTRQLGERLAMNTPIQGTAADIIKIAMNKVYERLATECPESKLILQIHDELIIQAKKSEREKVEQLLKECMEGAAELSVKLEVEENTADNWYDLK